MLFRRLTIFLLLGLFLLPGIESVVGIAPKVELVGEKIETPRPVFSFNGWFQGDLQTRIEDWLDDNIGFREYFIKTDNQINFSVFREVSSKTGTKILLGKDNYLYEMPYILDFNNRNRVNREILVEKSEKIKELGGLLKNRGIAFAVLIAPSKATIMPEYLPSLAVDPVSSREPSNYDQFAPMLDGAGVEVVDGIKFFLEEKKKNPYPLFVRGGTHWSHYGACLVSKEVVRRWGMELVRPVAGLGCEPVKMHENPVGKDRDLADLLNLWDPDAANGPTADPVISRVGTGQEFRPNVLYVGDSFIWQVAQIIESREVSRRRDVFYYFATNYPYPDGEVAPIVKDEIDWEREVFNHDIIMVETNEAALGEFGFGFVEAAVNALKVNGSTGSGR